MKEFVIPFSGLKTGIHHFDFNIDVLFFEAFDYKTYKEADLKVVIAFTKKETMLELGFEFDGFVHVRCDRCGEWFDLPLKGNQDLIVKFGEEREQISEEILILPHHEHQIDVAQCIYEMVVLATPYRRIHPEGEDGIPLCNPEIVAQLETLNTKTDNNIDPRWSELKDLLIEKKDVDNGTS